MPIIWRVSRPWLAALAAVLIPSMSIFMPLAATAQVSEEDIAKVRAVEASRIAAIEKVYHTVVAIYPPNRQGGGSGVVYDPAGYVLTNYHVTAGAGLNGVAGLADGKLYKWHLVGHDPGGDLAIIKLEGPTPDHRFQYAQLADSETVRVGDFAMAMGNPFILAEDQTPTITLGIVSGVKRYQPGTGPGGKMLEYGNCIQIDSSINPGNSGGPLFNMQGQVIGINGRGSFEERGRVNVGVGYAISANQCKLFIPELLATKTCEHGTLDAVFARRGNNEVVCESINLDSPLAKAGFELGDRLVKFNGQEIRSTHEFTNLIATLPAHWPVEVVWDHDGKQKSAWVRLSAITYPKPAARPVALPRPVPQPAPKQPEKKEEKAEEKPKEQGGNDAAPPAAEETGPIEPDEKKADDKSKDKEAPKAQPQPIQPLRPAPAAMEFGKIRDAKMNEREALRIVASYQEFMGGRKAIDDIKGIRVTYEGKSEGQAPVSSRVLIASDGRRKVDNMADGIVIVWDGQTYTNAANNKVDLKLEGDQAKLNPAVAFDMFYAALLAPKPASHFKRIVLQGTDQTQGQIAYRILFEDQLGTRFLAWFSVLDERGFAGAFETRLIKASLADDKDAPREPGFVRGDYRVVDGIQVHHSWALVTGLDEKVAVQHTAKKVEVLRELPADAFVIPQEKK